MGPAAQAPVATARPASASSAVHLRVLRRRRAGVKLEKQHPANITCLGQQLTGANPITAAAWAVEVAWLEIECVSVAGLGKGRRDYATFEIFKLD